jgi:hypothetical protein
MRVSCLFLLPLTLGLATPAFAMPGVSGSVDGWAVADAIAVVEDGETQLLVSDQAFDRARIAGDRRFDILDSAAHEEAGGQVLRIVIDGDGKMSSLGMGGMSSYTSDMSDALVLTARTDDRLVGRFDHGDTTLRFDLTVWRNGEIPRVGAALPAGGGEPGAALQAYFKAIAANDFDTFVALSPPSWRASMQASKAKGEAQLEIDAVAVELPSTPAITGGHGEAQRAWVDVTGTREGKPVEAVATLERDAQGWYVRRVDTVR